MRLYQKHYRTSTTSQPPTPLCRADFRLLPILGGSVAHWPEICRRGRSSGHLDDAELSSGQVSHYETPGNRTVPQAD